MSDIPPTQSMLIPDGSPSIPELRYDGAGNAYARDHVGNWVSHPGIARAVTRVQWPEDRVSQPYKQCAATPSLYGLTTFADFSQPRELSEPLPLPSGSRLVLGAARDPAQIPLPDSPDGDLCDPIVISEARGYTRTTKTAGARRKAVAKAPNVEDDKDDARTEVKPPSGPERLASNPLQVQRVGKQAWPPPRKAVSLETKFKQLVKTTKPTGVGVCPPDVSRAHHIDALINERAGTRDLNDSDFDANDSHDDSRNITPPIEHTAVTRTTRTDAPVPRRRGAAATELLTRISSAFDPAVQQARDEERANRSLATTQLLMQAQQLRDANAVTEQLRTQLYDLRTRLYDVEREHDLSKLRAEMLQMHGSAPNQAPPARRSSRHRHRPKLPSYTHYPDGGQSVIWHSDAETLTDHPPTSPRFTAVTPTDFGTSPSPRRREPFRWASRPRLRGGGARNSVVHSRGHGQGRQEPTDLKSEDDGPEPQSTEV
ncbi:hypothetical protein CY34DRAFT_19082 [Suillus luteus UH-Slu-Lm8-n1]|uniref:DUF6818 domain-containing protein n=1 Tax=Suillus luteus UH-Slu-Lm8-n1 TaxID=930992 RepID=A0A0D0ADU9_9AGAM|nr:hypothetical protein CY34DRAFT_19082 [Suillus luteus UH-Slu-Lm8-n1]